MSIRIGAVSYLNTKPLIYGLQQRLPECELSLDLPSRLADALRAGELDVALIPSVEFLRSPGFHIVTDACIACHGAVRSVRLLFRKPPSQIRSLALDEGSRTSAVLAQVLLADRFGIRPKLSPLAISAQPAASDADAILMIGDRAMQVDEQAFVECWDLGEQWTRGTGLPFVFAMWVAARPDTPQAVVEALQASRDAGMADIDRIVSVEADRYCLDEEDCRRYLTQQLHFWLGSRELMGLELFQKRAVALKLLPSITNQLSLEAT